MLVASLVSGPPEATAGEPDPRWNDEELGTLKKVKGSDFEVVFTGDPVKG